MPRGRDFLERFRPVGAPGAPAARGVPADRVAELAAELAPVLALLDPVQAQADAVLEDARAEAERRRNAARSVAEREVATARRRAESERATAAAGATRAADEQAGLDLATAQRAADEVASTSSERLPGLLSTVRREIDRRLDRLLGAGP